MAVSSYFVDYGAGNDSTGDGTVGTPWKTIQKALDTITRDTTNGDQINVKAGTAQVLGAALSFATYGTAGPLVIRGYTSAANDGGIGEIDCGGFAMLGAAVTILYLVDLKCHNFGNNNGITTGTNPIIQNCEIYKGASTPSSKILLVTGAYPQVRGCYLHDTGTGGSGISIPTNANGLVTHNRLTGMEANGIVLGNGAGTCEHNVIVCSAAAATGISSGHSNPIKNNSIYNSAAGTGRGIYVSASSLTGVITNNVIEGWSGAGGDAIEIAGDIGVLGYNAFYSNTNTITGVDEIFIDQTANDVALGASAFTNAAGGDFSVGAALKAEGWPSGIGPSTTTAVDIGAAQRVEAAVAYPAEADVEFGVSYGGGAYTGAFVVPAEADVKDTVTYGAAAEFTGTYAPAGCDYPAESDVRLGVDYDSANFTGTLDLPAEADVQAGVQFDGATKTGTFAAPAVGDVEAGVTYGAAAEYTGTFAVPAEADVADGVTYGAAAEFTGSLVGGSDWTADEKKQIRQALGVTGTTAATEATGDIKTQFAALADDSTIATAVRTELATELGYLTGPVALEATLTAIKGAGWTTQTLVAIVAAIGSGGITAQEVRDALKLAPTAGAPAAGSVDAELDAILEDTGTTLDDKLDTIDDFLDTEIAAIKAKTDLITTGTALTVVSAIDGGTITATIAASLAATLTGLTISADWAKVYLTVKRHTSDTDAQSLLQVVVSNPAAAATDGTLYVNGAAASVAQRTQAAITVTQATGVIAIALDEALTGAIREGFGLTYDLKELTTGGAANVLAQGTWNWVYTPTWAVT